MNTKENNWKLSGDSGAQNPKKPYRLSQTLRGSRSLSACSLCFYKVHETTNFHSFTQLLKNVKKNIAKKNRAFPFLNSQNFMIHF